MSTWTDDPFEVVEETASDFESLSRREVASADVPMASGTGATLARFAGFDLDERPLVSGLIDVPHEVLAARSTVALRQDQIGSTVVLLFERNDPRQPIIVGVVHERAREATNAALPGHPVSVQADGERLVLTAEREIVLRCGAASITLTRAGKVLIKGAYVLSRSSGYNRIKGAAIDIN